MEALCDEEFDAILGEALDLLPAGVTEQLDNVALFVEDRPENGDRHLLGLYEGTPIGERGIAFEMPDNIFIYRDNLIDFAEDRDHLREESSSPSSTRSRISMVSTTTGSTSSVGAERPPVRTGQRAYRRVT